MHCSLLFYGLKMLLRWIVSRVNKKKQGGGSEDYNLKKQTKTNKKPEQQNAQTKLSKLNKNNPKLLPSWKEMLYSRCLSYTSLWTADVHLIPQCSAFSGPGKNWAANVVCTVQAFPPELSQTSCFVLCPQKGSAVCSTVLPSTVPCFQSCATPTCASVQKVRNDYTGWSKRR